MPLITSPTGHLKYQFPISVNRPSSTALDLPVNRALSSQVSSTNAEKLEPTHFAADNSHNKALKEKSKRFLDDPGLAYSQPLHSEGKTDDNPLPHISEVRPLVYDQITDTVRDALEASNLVAVHYDFWARDHSTSLIHQVQEDLAQDHEVILADEGINDLEAYDRFLQTIIDRYGGLFLDDPHYNRFLDTGFEIQYLISNALRCILESDQFTAENPLVIIFDGYEIDGFRETLLKSILSWVDERIDNFKVAVFYRHGKLDSILEKGSDFVSQSLQIGEFPGLTDQEIEDILNQNIKQPKTQGQLLKDYSRKTLDENRFTEIPLSELPEDKFDGQDHPLVQLTFKSKVGRSIGQNRGTVIYPSDEISVINGGAFEVCSFLIVRNTMTGALGFFHVWPGTTYIQDVESIIKKIYENEVNIKFDATTDKEHRREKYTIHVKQASHSPDELTIQTPLEVIVGVGQRSIASEARAFLEELTKKGYPIDIDKVQIVGMNKGRMHLQILYDRHNDQLIFQKNGEGKIYRFAGFKARYGSPKL